MASWISLATRAFQSLVSSGASLWRIQTRFCVPVELYCALTSSNLESFSLTSAGSGQVWISGSFHVLTRDFCDQFSRSDCFFLLFWPQRAIIFFHIVSPCPFSKCIASKVLQYAVGLFSRWYHGLSPDTIFPTSCSETEPLFLSKISLAVRWR